LKGVKTPKMGVTNHTCPWLVGSWEAPSYSPDTGLLYQNVVEACNSFDIQRMQPETVPLSGLYYGGSPEAEHPPGGKAYGHLDARDPITGAVKWELKFDQPMYSSLLTTGGGLYRYRLGDRVRVVGFAGHTPLLEFLGKEDGVSDLCGEKLSPAFVASVLEELSVERAYLSDFAMLAPARQESLRYVLFLEGATSETDLAVRLDKKLTQNPHYAYCRRLGQLAAPRIFQITSDAGESYLRRCVAMGQRAGAVKAVALHRLTGWEDFFRGDWTEQRTRQKVEA